LTGTVHDATGTPIPAVTISALAANRSTRTDSAGYFSLSGLRPGPTAFGVRRIGFDSAEFTLQLDTGTTVDVNVILAESPAPLLGVTTRADAHVRQVLKGFYARRDADQGGHFFVRSEIEARHVTTLSDLLRAVPGIQIGEGRNNRNVARMARSSAGTGQDCPVAIWVDGSRMPGLNIDDISPRDVEAIEVYSGAATVPPAFNSRLGGAACGTIAIWTRVP
jgi:outer membrane receptor for monomeric catechols